jgi:hypothetical protein
MNVAKLHFPSSSIEISIFFLSGPDLRLSVHKLAKNSNANGNGKIGLLIVYEETLLW